MEKFFFFFLFIKHSNIINFLIMVWLLGYFVKKMNLSKSFEQGIENVKSLITKSDEARSTSKKHFDEAQILINGLPEDIKNLEANSADKINIFKDKINENAKKTIFNLSTNIEKLISIEEKKISNLLTEATSKDAISQAKINLEKLLEEKPQLHDKFIENSIAELDRIQI